MTKTTHILRHLPSIQAMLAQEKIRGFLQSMENCQAQVHVPNPEAQIPDPKSRPSLRNPKTQFFGLGLTQ